MKTMLSPMVRALVQVVSGALVANGVLTSTDSAQFIEVMTGAVLFTVSLAWSSWEKANIKAAAKVTAEANVAADKAQ